MSEAFRTTSLRDSTRFLVLRQPEQRPATQIHVVANWSQELKRLVPAS